MSKRARKRRARKKNAANHGRKPNAWSVGEPRRRPTRERVGRRRGL